MPPDERLGGVMNRFLRAVLPCLAILAGGCADKPWAPASATSQADVILVQAYDGPALDGEKVAVVYGFDGLDAGDAQWVCTVDGHDLQRTVRLQQRCANAVFLLPGDHELLWRYHSRSNHLGLADGDRHVVGSGKLHVHVEAGRVYRLLVDGGRKTVLAIPQSGRPDMLPYSRINPNYAYAPIDYAHVQPLDDQ